ncbi:TonB-dependent receptor [Sediminitomix flava]|uniref:TonB-dependent receptor n=1 Tax=Sediminitomix flava TaxID=379075 RepID=A0A315ZFP6_SEDFL|nr:TonB-dependent receptor [Sediminitomix flava]PWJ43983.1 TonB-dependent receptor [Sediminitomix flava]
MKRQLKLYASILLVLIIFPMLGFSQSTGSINGKITDSEGNVLSYAIVSIESSKYATTSDINGNYSIGGIPEGKHILQVAYLGYNDSQKEIEVIAGKNTKTNFILDENAIELEGAIVYGAATRGQAKAFNEQKNSLSVKNVVSSEVFSTMPDRNGAESLQRIPGISIDRNRGEGQNIQIRGMASEYNQVQMNGTPLPGGEGDRGAALDFLAADLMESIEVRKTLTPDMDGGAIGGAVNFTLKDAPEVFTVKALISGGKNFHIDPFNDGWGLGQQNHNIYLGNRFFNNKLGVMVNASYYETNRGTVLNEYTINDEDQLTRKRWNDYDVRRVRAGVNTGLDYRFNDNHVIRATYNYNHFNDDRRRGRTNFNFKYDDLGDVSDFSEDRETQSRAKYTKMDMYGIGGENKFNNGLELDYKFTHIRTRVQEPDGTQYYFSRDLSPDVLAGRDIWALSGEDALDPSNKLIADKPARTDLKENMEIDNSFVLNAALPFNFLNQRSTLKAGYKYWSKTKDNEASRFSHAILDPNLSLAPGQFYRRDMRFTDAEFGQYYDVNGSETYSVRNQNYHANETINAAYLMSDLNWTSKFTTLVGVRVEHTTNSYSVNEYEDDNGSYIRTLNDKSSYINVLPSINAVYRIDDKNSIKAAATKGISRPSFTSLIPREVIDDENLSMSISNPDLKPVNSTNFDLIFERYTSNMGYFTAGAFAKFLDNQIVSTQIYEEREDGIWTITKPMNGGDSHLYGFEVAYNHSFKNLDLPFVKWMNIMANYTFTMSRQTVDILAEEAGNGFEKGEVIDNRTVVMGNSPRDIANLILTYDNPKNGLMVSLAGNYRGPLLISTDPYGNEMRDIYFSQQFHLDLSASYQFSKHYTVFTQMNNLTNQMEKEMYGHPYESSILHQTEQYGPTFTMGLRAEF